MRVKRVFNVGFYVGYFLALLPPGSGRDHLVNSNLGETDVPGVKDGLVAVVSHITVHHGVFPDKLENGVGQRPGVRDTRPGAGLRHGCVGHWQPHGGRSGLLLCKQFKTFKS